MEERWVVGLSIDEEVVIGAARINRDYKFTMQNQPQLQRKLLGPEQTGKAISLERDLRDILNKLKIDPIFGNIFEQTLTIGVSTIGLVNRDTLRLTDIARKNWVDEENEFGERNCVIDFGRLFDTGLFPNLMKVCRDTRALECRAINVHNDATAGCLLEYRHQPRGDDRTKVLFYVMVSEGINGGLVVDGYPVATELHSEIGHIWPRLHPSDKSFDQKQSGCPIHKECFEGVSSGARIRKSWGNNSLHELGRPKRLEELLPDYPVDKDHPWDRIAYYIAQLCMVATLGVSPGRILVGGEVVFPHLIPVIRRHFEHLNCGGTHNEDGSRRDYMKYEAMLRDDFIQIARIRQNERVQGALELARLAASSPQRALWTVRSSPAGAVAPFQRIDPKLGAPT